MATQLRPDTARGIDPDTAVGIYRTMARIAEADRRVVQALSAGEMYFQYYPAGGQEAIPAALAPHLRRDDHAVITYRCIHDTVAKGVPLREVFAELYGRAAGTSKGKGGPMHLSDPKSGLMATTGIVGAGAPIATGLALAAQLKGTGRVTICTFGDGAANIGAVHEALNLAALWRLPLVFVCQNNLYAEYTSYADSTASPDIAGRAAGYGMAGERVDGTDPIATWEAMGRAVERARSGQGPTLLECVAHRLQGHAFGSPEEHMDAAQLAAARANPPLKTYRARLLAEGWADAAALDSIDAEAKAEVDDAQEFARGAQAPAAHEFENDIFADVADLPGHPRPAAAADPPAGATIKMTYGAAVNAAMDHALATDADVIVLGEDIEDPAGGIVKATLGLSTKHGRERVRGTPISEQAIVGAAIGASLAGLKPIAEIMINDFAMVAMDQISNHAAKLRYMSGGRTSVPIVLRMLTAGAVGSFGAQHSQSLEAWFAHTPGLKVVAPSTPADAHGLILSALDDPDPVIVLEAMRCYFGKGDVEVGRRVPLGQAAMLREGRDLSIIGYGWALQEAQAAVAELDKDGIDAELIDLRSLVPLDFATVAASVRKTGRALVTHAAVEFCGFGAELAARIQEELWGELETPVLRVGAAYTPIPFAPNLESLHFPTGERIAAAARRLMERR